MPWDEQLSSDGESGSSGQEEGSESEDEESEDAEGGAYGRGSSPSV